MRAAEREPVADSPEIWFEQMRRHGAVVGTEKIVGKGELGQGIAEIVAPEAGPAFIQTGLGVGTVWFNGVQVHDQKGAWTGAHLGKERISVALKKGSNSLVIEFKNNFFLAVTPVFIWEDLLSFAHGKKSFGA